MYKNFNLTDKEREQILEQHSEYGYGKPLNEQSNDKDVNEQNPFLRFAKNMISPEVKVLRQGSSTIVQGVKNPAVKSLLTKYGTIAMTDFIKGTLRPFEDNMIIFVNYYKKLQNLKVPSSSQYDYVSFLKQDIDAVRTEIAVTKGSSISLDLLYHNTQQLNRGIDNILAAKQIKPQGVATLKGMKQTVDNALEAIEDALGQIATKK
jgi:hypothetical protein